MPAMDGTGAEEDPALIGDETLPLGPRLELRLPANPEVLAPMRRLLARWLKENGVDERVGFDIVLTCSEASANATEHAYPPREGHFDVVAVRDADDVVITVSDNGTWRPEEERDRGRGLVLMRGLTDELTIDRPEGGGTIVTLRRRVAGASDA
jgi:anti-sigma regulatory factor (Ser/Thr protein kinase)